jgi:hypothetical protein
METGLAGWAGRTRTAESVAAYSRAQQLKREQSLAARFLPSRRKLPRNLRYIVRARIPEFESDVPSHAVDGHCRPASPPLNSYRRQ